MPILFPPFTVKINQIVADNKRTITFILRLILFFLVWKIAFHFIWANPSLERIYNNFSLIIIDAMLVCCKQMLELLGYLIEIDNAERIVRIHGSIGVTVGEPCIGFGVSAFFTALIFSTTGAFHKKIWFVPIGLIIISLGNLLRICALTIMVESNPRLWEVNHKFVFTIIIYSCVFILWSFWIKISNKEVCLNEP